MSLQKLVNEIRLQNNQQTIKRIKEADSMLEKVIYSKRYLSSQQWGKLLEQEAIKHFNFKNIKSNTKGDCVCNGKYIEIKISLTKDVANFVQIRPHHEIDYYLFIVYNIMHGDLGKLHYIFMKSEDVYFLLPKYGGLAHGTNKKKNSEYCLRPRINMTQTTKTHQLWMEFLKHDLNKEEIKNVLSKA